MHKTCMQLMKQYAAEKSTSKIDKIPTKPYTNSRNMAKIMHTQKHLKVVPT